MTRTMMLILVLAGFGLSACNTVEGVGRDVQYTGHVVTQSADAVGDRMKRAMQ